MRGIAKALFAAESTRGRKDKVEALAGALRDVAASEPERLPFAARFLTGTMLPTEDDRTLGTGGRLVFDAACIVTGSKPDELGARSRSHGDLGTAVGEALEAARGVTETETTREYSYVDDDEREGLLLRDAEEVANTLASTGARADKLAALTSTLAKCSPLEARYFVRAVLGEMRVGAKEGIVEDAISKAFGRPLASVRHAHGLVTDVGELARLAFEDRLGEAEITLGRPLGFMLATPIETARGVDLTQPHAVEDKIDGIRAQAHIGKDFVKLFARGKGPVTNAFPDIVRPLEGASLPNAILDGEIVVVAPDGRVRPFSALQPRLKKTIELEDDLVKELPVRYLAYDMLFEGDESLLALPFLERRRRLEAWAANAPPPLQLHTSRALVIEGKPEDADKAALDPGVDREFDAARARGFEGLVLKRLDAPYAAGVRGFAWLKVKKAFATLDCVIVAAERGHGKRAGVLSDYTFAVQHEGVLEVVGKAYSGLTDVEIKAITARLESIAIGEERHGRIPVRPEIVLEIAFDGIQKSARHSSGYALRFPRIARIRDDKEPDEANTVDDVKALYDAQLATGHREDVVVKKGGRKSGRRPDIRKNSKQLKLFDD